MREYKNRLNGMSHLIIAIIASTILLFLNTAEFGFPIFGISAGIISLYIGFAINGYREQSFIRSRIAFLSTAVLLVPMATSSPNKALPVLVAAGIISLSVILPKKISLIVGSISLVYALSVTMPGLGLLIPVYILFFALSVSVVISRSKTGNMIPLSPAYTIGILFLVVAVTAIEVANRNGLPGSELPTAQWALLGLIFFATTALVSIPTILRTVGRRAIPVMLIIATFAMTLSPTQGTIELVKAENGGASLLAAIAGSRGSTSMIGEEGAGPRAHFRGVPFDGCDAFNLRDCLITYFDSAANRKGIQVALDEIVDKVSTNQGASFPAHCHQVVHNLGQMAYELADGDFELVSSYDPQVCGTGFIHGLYEKYFNRYGNYIFTETGDICEKMNLTNKWYAWTCNHILGHTVSSKMMESPVEAAEFCLQLLDSFNFADCSSGAWMNFWADDIILDWYGKNAMNKPEEVFKVCYAAIRDSKFYCYQEIFPALVKISNDNLPLMASWCEKYSEVTRTTGPVYLQTTQDYKDRCMQGVARAVAVVSNYDYRVGILRCDELRGLTRDSCLTAMGSSVVMNTGSITAGLEVCERVKDKGYRDYCFVWAKQTVTTLTSGPNADNIPAFGEVRTPGKSGNIPLPPKETSATGN
jgi:hypothetical protein